MCDQLFCTFMLPMHLSIHFNLAPILLRRSVKAWIEANAVKRAVVIGGGFIGLEMVENLAHLGIQVEIVEMAPQVTRCSSFAIPPKDACPFPLQVTWSKI